MYSWRRAGITASLTLLTGSHVNHKVDFSIHRRVMTLTDRTYAKPSILYYLDDTPVITTILPRFTGDMSVLVYHLSNIGPSGRNWTYVSQHNLERALIRVTQGNLVLTVGVEPTTSWLWKYTLWTNRLLMYLQIRRSTIWAILALILVSQVGLEPTTLCSQSRCATRLRYWEVIFWYSRRDSSPQHPDS